MTGEAPFSASLACSEGDSVVKESEPSVGLKGSLDSPTRTVPREGIQAALQTILPVREKGAGVSDALKFERRAERRVGERRRTLRESSSLVGANVGDGTESLERVELANNHVALDHGASAAGEGDGEDDLMGGRGC